MVYWIIKQAAISLIFIILLHRILIFLTTTFTKPDVIDLVHAPTEQYREMYSTIQDNDLVNEHAGTKKFPTFDADDNKSSDDNIPTSSVTHISSLPTSKISELSDNMKDSMQQELQEYLNGMTVPTEETTSQPEHKSPPSSDNEQL